MTTAGFVATHAKDARFERGLRAFFEYRDLGIREATQGRFAAHVIRAAGGAEFASQPHLHRTEFQLVYVLKGWIEFEFEYEGQGPVRLEAGSCVHQPLGIRHRELGHSDDVEMLEIVLPANFTTVELYTDKEVSTLWFVRQSQDLGFSIEQDPRVARGCGRTASVRAARCEHWRWPTSKSWTRSSRNCSP